MKEMAKEKAHLTALTLRVEQLVGRLLIHLEEMDSGRSPP